MEYQFTKETSEDTIRRRLRRNGWSHKRIAGFLRGWLVVKNNKEK